MEKQNNSKNEKEFLNDLHSRIKVIYYKNGDKDILFILKLIEDYLKDIKTEKWIKKNYNIK
jgi:hypothetical protein